MNSLRVARAALETNIVPAKAGPLLVCGPGHFHSFWVRDFCFSVPALLLLGKYELVKEHLDRCLDHIREDGLMPRGFDVIDPKVRVALGVFGLRASKIWPYASKDLKPEFNGEHNTPAVDSNILVLECCLLYERKTGDKFFSRERFKKMGQAFEGLLRLRRGQLLYQPGFSDWQDSAKREGHTFYLNILFYRLVRTLQELGFDWSLSIDRKALLETLWQEFYSKEDGLFVNSISETDTRRFSLESLLWCIEGDFFKDYVARAELWKNLKASPLCSPLASCPVWPQYPSSEISWTTKFVGLRHYHDKFHWSWLMGESLKVCCVMGDKPEADRLFTEIERLTAKYGTVHEIYEFKNGTAGLVPVRRPLYMSENPFSWGSAKLIEGLMTYQEFNNENQKEEMQ